MLNKYSSITPLSLFKDFQNNEDGEKKKTTTVTKKEHNFNHKATGT